MKKIIITEEQARQRFDKFLAQEFFSYSRGEIVRQIKSGNILLNDKIVKPSHVLKENDAITIKAELEIKKEVTPNPKVKLNIIYKNQDFLVLEKPAGIQVHPSSQEKERTLVNGLIVKFPEIIGIGDNSADSWLRPGIVHRLDKDTSGVMLVARNQKAFNELKKLFHSHHIRKEYAALVYGKLGEKAGIIRRSLARATSYRKQTIATSRTTTKVRAAVTSFQTIHEFSDQTLVRAFPKTGRTHQIRIHFASLGHPVVGDKVYGTRLYKSANENYKRHFLHATKISFALFGEQFSFSSPLPDDFPGGTRNID